ncbi:MAG: deoxyribose-phosphate aldolase [Clostridiales Family XIII bacterium]|jgi:deoxyribose-phosphate aldolase|nr:deoxyribose-phosphate aldolase [Clostridiales Family XIII bacterium]
MDTEVKALDIAKMIDVSLLRPDMPPQEVLAGCRLAREYDCISVCVKPCDVSLSFEALKGSDVLTTTVIGFPHGSNVTEVKLKEAGIAIDQGCAEIDVVLNIGRLKGGDNAYIEEEVKAITDYAHGKGAVVKIIFENAYLTEEEKIKACEICVKAGVDFVKTSTGYAGGGATIPDLKLMRSHCPEPIAIKAAGGVRSLEAALMVLAVCGSGCRFGCTRTDQIMKDARAAEAAGTLTLPDPAGLTAFPQG